MPMVCTRVTEWLEENIWKPVAEWEDRTRKDCKKLHWYDPRSWFCWLVHYVVKVLRWVVSTIIKLVVTIVCRVIARVLDLIYEILRMLYLFGKALITWDKCTAQEGVAGVADLIASALTSLYVVVDPVADLLARERLRNYVDNELARRFPDDIADTIRASLRVKHGVFGLRCDVTVHRMYVDSQTMTPRFADVPNLLGLHLAGTIDLYALAGFTTPCRVWDFKHWYHPRPQRAKYPFAAGGGAGHVVPPEFTRDDLDEYISSRGQRGPHFRIYSIAPNKLDDRINTAEEYGRRLGLILSFHNQEIEVLDPKYMVHWTQFLNDEFLSKELGRTRWSVDPVKAAMQLCSPVAVAVFGFENRTQVGQTSNPFGTTECAAHNQIASDTSGVSFCDGIPDEIRRYVLIHELGHYFGLCHVDGFSRIMVSGEPGQGDWLTWRAVWESLAYGGPRFTVEEGMQAWRFILNHFPVACLTR